MKTTDLDNVSKQLTQSILVTLICWIFKTGWFRNWI